MRQKALCGMLAGLFMIPAQARAEQFFSREQKQAAGSAVLIGLTIAAAAAEAHQRNEEIRRQQAAVAAAQRAAAAQEEQARIQAQAEADRLAREAAEAEARAESARQALIARARSEWSAIAALDGDARGQRAALVNSMLNKDYRDSRLLQDESFAAIYRGAIELYLDQYASPELKVLAMAQSDETFRAVASELRALYVARFDAELIHLSVKPAAVFNGSPAKPQGLLKVILAKAAAVPPLAEALSAAQAGQPTEPAAAPTQPKGKRTTIFGNPKNAEQWASYDAAVKSHDAAVADYQQKKSAFDQKVSQADAALKAAVNAVATALKDLAAALKDVSSTGATKKAGSGSSITLGTDDLRNQ